ncbi:hypothetical protein KJ575_00630 [Patescibacteria group bacterium]|nr:hypothetical protein [Patescibacteria group bacterium]MBU4368211.1 hypothetical protein [Patescibacteria group bacterium]
MFRERESGFGGADEEKLKQIKAETEIAVGSVGNKEVMERAVEKRKGRKAVFSAATELAKKKIEVKERK